MRTSSSAAGSGVALTCVFGLGAAGVLLPTSAAADMLEVTSPNETAQGNFGRAVAGVPDLNGDGVDDVIVGAPREHGSGVTNSGRVYVFSGRTGLLIRTHVSPNPTLLGRFGNAVAGVRDITGDGAGDYVVGAPRELGAAGRVYVYSGSTGALLRTHVSPGSQPNGEFGASVSGIDDFTGDGRGEYIVGAPGEVSQRGRAYVFSGSSGANLYSHDVPGGNPLAGFGHSVAGVPDLDADGRGDYVIGAPFDHGSGQPALSGRAFVYSGYSGGVIAILSSPDPQDTGRFGWAVAGVPDADGDGSGDILIGCPYEDVGSGANAVLEAGRAHLISGFGGALLKTFVPPAAHQHAENFFGWSVAGIKDRSGDGLGDVVIGAPGWPGYDVYVHRGAGDYGLLETITSPDLLGANQFYGGAVASVGDANGDGRGDFVIGALGADNAPDGPSESGRAYIHRSPLTNDTCSALSLITLSDGPNPVTNIGAQGGGSGSPCLNVLQSDVWYRYTATCTGALTFSTCGSAGFDTVIAVYAGCPISLPTGACLLGDGPIACVDDTPGCGGFTTRVTIDAVENQCFLVRLGGYLGAQGVGTLKVICGCLADLDGSGMVDGADLGILLGQWGGPGFADLDGNGVVDGADLGLLLGAWGGC
ncbi:MAG TPA: integrin alpha [Phycisphaerales bacterium]|nr:integrin alpha [Phycisphaerales bacterium]HMP38697.1 integrin alpha [Phycisphaerales bacterium]